MIIIMMTFACSNDNDEEDGNGEERLGGEEAVKLQVESHHRASQSPQSATASPLKDITIFTSFLIFILDPHLHSQSSSSSSILDLILIDYLITLIRSMIATSS